MHPWDNDFKVGDVVSIDQNASNIMWPECVGKIYKIGHINKYGCALIDCCTEKRLFLNDRPWTHFHPSWLKRESKFMADVLKIIEEDNDGKETRKTRQKRAAAAPGR